ncbi:unnamed protein product [Ceutorhynchus assimilis]|uniref:Ig-like domain-containing protein n=1 Tax=Ceutorhynchus assimilis TaxID=467358 RepID=A0A9P0DDP8_9CUCU|nr:unnamed protein product [Ceutorhynchus assimilis]
MDVIRFFGIFGYWFFFFSHVNATLQVTDIIGPDSIELGTTEELILDCEFEAQNENDVVLKWFFNGLEDQIYQWIIPNDHAYASGSLKEFIDPTYRASEQSNGTYRALRFKKISSELTGNFTCKVDSDDGFHSLTKQVIVYSPATSFEIFLIGGDDEFEGDEVVLCDALNVSPKPDFDIYISSENGSLEIPSDMFTESKRITPDIEGVYNVSITLSFNSSYLSESTKFVCRLSIPGTNYTEVKSVEYFVDSGKNPLQASIVLALLLMFSLVLAT